jgi:hypothetical protein
MAILGMQPAEGSEAVPPHARSHTVLLAGQLPGDERALVRCACVRGGEGGEGAERAALGRSWHAGYDAP